jgi:glucosamine 6-phosphate synthetase-like amidotransferase/phosphosugar isomerase protein
MCGVFGFVAKNDSRPDMARLIRIAQATEARGRHAFGFAWVDSAGHLKMFKQTGKISDGIGLLKMASDARMLIGHCRYATDGDPRYNINNHPHPIDGGWFVHNGVVSQYDAIVRQYELHCISHCDSEVIGQLYETSEGPAVDRLIDACHTATTSPLVVLSLWKNPRRLIALRAGNPLELGETKNAWYFASLADGLPRPYMVRDNTALEFNVNKSGVAAMTAYDASLNETV